MSFRSDMETLALLATLASQKTGPYTEEVGGFSGTIGDVSYSLSPHGSPVIRMYADGPIDLGVEGAGRLVADLIHAMDRIRHFQWAQKNGHDKRLASQRHEPIMDPIEDRGTAAGSKAEFESENHD